MYIISVYYIDIIKMSTNSFFLENSILCRDVNYLIHEKKTRMVYLCILSRCR